MEWNWKLGGLQVLFIILVSRSLCLCWSLNDEGTFLFYVWFSGKWTKGCDSFFLLCFVTSTGLALLRLRERVVSDPFDALKNWKSSDTENDPCSWFGVGCYEGKVVILWEAFFLSFLSVRNFCLVSRKNMWKSYEFSLVFFFFPLQPNGRYPSSELAALRINIFCY